MLIPEYDWAECPGKEPSMSNFLIVAAAVLMAVLLIFGKTPFAATKSFLEKKAKYEEQEAAYQAQKQAEKEQAEKEQAEKEQAAEV